MLKVEVFQPQDYVIGRTQADRLRIRLSLVPPVSSSSESSSSSEESQQVGAVTDPYLFVVHEDDDGFTQFDRICQPYDLAHLGLTGSPRRTDLIDCTVPSRDLSDLMLTAVLSDLQDLCQAAFGISSIIRLSGADV